MVFVKDLSKIGRPLNKTIIVDNVAENFSLQPDNGIFIKSWFEDPSDTALLELAPLLKCKFNSISLFLTLSKKSSKRKSKTLEKHCESSVTRCSNRYKKVSQTRSSAYD